MVEVKVGAEKRPRSEAFATPRAEGFAADWTVATQDAGEYPVVVVLAHGTFECAAGNFVATWDAQFPTDCLD